jgi:uncharacterized damage-inducible protein DinB
MSDASDLSRRVVLEARLGRVRKDLDQAVGRLNQEMMDWAPRDGMRTVAGQLVEIIATEMQLVAELERASVPSDDQVREWLENWRELETLTKALNEVRAHTLEYLRSLSEFDLEQPIGFSRSWTGLSTLPRAEVIVSVAAHEWYHVGQLVSYLWFRGDDPYKW